MATPVSGAPAILVFGLQDAPVRWLLHRLRQAGVAAVRMPPDLSLPAAQSLVAAADAGVHLLSARQGLDARYLEYWQLLAESSTARYVAVHDLTPDSLDAAEAAAIAGRVLEEEVPSVTLPLLDDDESVMGVLDVGTGVQWFPDGHREPPRDDFTEAIELETNALFDEADAVGAQRPDVAIRTGLLPAAVAIDTATAAGVGWMAAHLPARRVPAASTVLPGDHPDLPLVAAGPEGIAVGPALALTGIDTVEVRVTSLAGLLEPSLQARVPAGAVAVAAISPVPAVGALLLPG